MDPGERVSRPGREPEQRRVCGCNTVHLTGRIPQTAWRGGCRIGTSRAEVRAAKPRPGCATQMYLLSLSVLLRTIALAWSLHLFRRVRDLRLGLLVALVGMFLVSATMPLLESWALRAPVPAAAELEQIDDLVESILLLLSVLFVSRMVGQRN